MAEAGSEELAIVSTFVLSGMEPLRLLIHHEDGTWDFLCNTTGDPQHLVTMHSDEAFDRFGSELQHLRSLPRGHLAERPERGSDWHVEPFFAE